MNERLCDAITVIEEKNRLTDGKINSLEAENKELYHIISELKASRAGGGDITPRAEPRATTNTHRPPPTRIVPSLTVRIVL